MKCLRTKYIFHPMHPVHPAVGCLQAVNQTFLIAFASLTPRNHSRASAARSLLLPVDVEYATWANPRSESPYF